MIVATTANDITLTKWEPEFLFTVVDQEQGTGNLTLLKTVQPSFAWGRKLESQSGYLCIET